MTGIRAGTTGNFTAVPQNGTSVVVNGAFGQLEIDNDGSYTYTRHEDARDGGTDVFTYQITDGDGDTDTATLTITVPDINSVPTPFSLEPFGVDEDGLPNANSDDGQTNPTEVDNGGNATRTGQAMVDYRQRPSGRPSFARSSSSTWMISMAS